MVHVSRKFLNGAGAAVNPYRSDVYSQCTFKIKHEQPSEKDPSHSYTSACGDDAVAFRNSDSSGGFRSRQLF
jgi:hypothetical protein